MLLTKPVHTCENWSSVATETGGAKLILSACLSSEPLKKLGERNVTIRLYAKKLVTYLFKLDAEPPLTSSPNTITIGDWADSLGPLEPGHPWHYAKSKDGNIWKINTEEFTTEVFDPAVATEKWQKLLTTKKVTPLEPYQNLVKSPKKYKGKTFHKKIKWPSGMGINLFDSALLSNSNGSQGMSFVINDEEFGYFSILVPFYELKERKNWSREIELLLQFVSVVDERQDKMPLMRAIAAFDGFVVYEDEPERCKPYWSSYVSARREYVDSYWSCLQQADSPQKCRSEIMPSEKKDKSSAKMFYGCMNAYPGTKQFKRAKKKSKSLSSSAGFLADCMKIIRFEKGTIKFEEIESKLKKAINKVKKDLVNAAK